jgi:hypothetical protein
MFHGVVEIVNLPGLQQQQQQQQEEEEYGVSD